MMDSMASSMRFMRVGFRLVWQLFRLRHCAMQEATSRAVLIFRQRETRPGRGEPAGFQSRRGYRGTGQGSLAPESGVFPPQFKA